MRRNARAIWTRLAIAASTIVWLSGGAGFGQDGLDFEISVSPSPNLATKPLVAKVKGVGSRPMFFEPVVGAGVVTIPYIDGSGILSPPPEAFTRFVLIPPLPAGIWEIELVLSDITGAPTSEVLAATTVTVTDPRFSVVLEPSPATDEDIVVAHVRGELSCLVVFDPVIEPGRIELSFADGGICFPPPPPMPINFDVEIGLVPQGGYLVELFFGSQRVAENQLTVVEGGTCIANATTLCLENGRFRVQAEWTTADSASGAAQAIPETDDTGLFWFFESSNTELLVKVLDGCDTEIGNYWVFAGGLTDVGVELTVTDTQTGDQVTYNNPIGQPFETITDTQAFASCPEP